MLKDFSKCCRVGVLTPGKIQPQFLPGNTQLRRKETQASTQELEGENECERKKGESEDRAKGRE